MLSRNLARVQRILQGRDIEPEDGHHKREGNGGEDVEILGGFVEGGWVLEDAETTGA